MCILGSLRRSLKRSLLNNEIGLLLCAFRGPHLFKDKDMRTLIIRFLLSSLVVGSVAFSINSLCSENDVNIDLYPLAFERVYAYLASAASVNSYFCGNIDTISQLRASIILYLERHEKSPPAIV